MHIPPPVVAFLLMEGGLESLSGNSGWFGAGLLGLVLAWLLMVHLPAKDKQQKELLTSRDQLMESQLTAERSSCEKRHQDNLAEMRASREIYERRHIELLAHHNQAHMEDKEVRHKINNVETALSVWIALMKNISSGQLPDLPAKKAEGR